MSYGTVQAEKMTTESGYSLGAGNASSFKNRIINGGMTISQRNGTSVVTPADGDYTLDRWRLPLSQPSKLTIQQSTTAPTGFSNSALITSTSAYSVGASEGFLFAQKIEGFNFADTAWGTASAKTVTLSFWVRSSLTGTFGGSLSNSANNRWYAFSYTINAANTWEQKSVTITGDTSGTWVGATNSTGLNIYFSVGSGSSVNGTAGSWGSSTIYSVTGSTNVVGTNGATWFITGVQLEVGTVATSFDFRSYGTELQLCQRYYYRIDATGSNQRAIIGIAYGSTEIDCLWTFPQTMRSSPTVAVPGLGNVLKEGVAWYVPASATAISSAPTFANIAAILSSSAFSQGEAGWWGQNGNQLTLTASAEL